MENEYERRLIRKDGTLTVNGLMLIISLGGIKGLSEDQKFLILSDDKYAEKFSEKIGSVIIE